MRILFAFALLLLACAARDAGTLEPSVRSAITVLTDLADPACALAKESCLLRQDLALSQAEAGDRAMRETYRAITRRCAVVMDTCDAIRQAQLSAVSLVDEGKVDAARLEVERAREAARGLTLEEDGGSL